MNNKTILAVGADIKNRFLVARRRDVCLGPAIGDLSDGRNFEQFKKAIGNTFKKIKDKPSIIAHDLHPGYFSTQFAKTYQSNEKNCRCIAIQHHHAHIASVMHTHNIKKPVIGVSFDGTGFGADGNIWGGEFLLVNKSGFKRLAHFAYIKMPGGEKVVQEPWRMVLSILGKKGAGFLREVKKDDKEIIFSMIEKDINCPLTSSAGRLFDAAAALLGICQYASFEAEGPIKLEDLCQKGNEAHYQFNILKKENCTIIDTKPLFEEIAKDLKKKESKSIMATKFHNTICQIIVQTVKKLAKETEVRNVALSGGVFQNKFLMSKTMEMLKSFNGNIFTNKTETPSDLNIALGQYYVSCRTSRN